MSGELTYAEVGGTRAASSSSPPGYFALSRRSRIGGPDVFEAAAEFVLGFGLQRGAGFRVRSGTPTAEEGTEAVLQAWFGPVRVVAPVRVVYVVDSADRRGFAYGTLPGHPECGEERFVVTREADGTWLEIRAFSRPGRWFARVAGPLGRLLQRRVTARYFSAVRRAVCS